MKLGSIALSVMLLLSVQVGPCLGADDWVDDDQVSGFYKKGIIRSPEDYQNPPQGMAAPASPPQQGMQFPDELGGIAPPVESYPFDGTNQPPPANRQPGVQPKSGGSFLGKLGKSIVNAPKNLLMGGEDLFDDPALWQSAGAVAGMGANAYMNYKWQQRNPMVYGGYNPYGYNPYTPYSSVNPLGGFGFNPFGGARFNIGGGGLMPYGGYYPNSYASPYGIGNALNPYMPYGGIGGYGLGGYGMGGYGLGGYGLGGYGLGGFNNGIPPTYLNPGLPGQTNIIPGLQLR